MPIFENLVDKAATFISTMAGISLGGSFTLKIWHRQKAAEAKANAAAEAFTAVTTYLEAFGTTLTAFAIEGDPASPQASDTNYGAQVKEARQARMRTIQPLLERAQASLPGVKLYLDADSVAIVKESTLLYYKTYNRLGALPMWWSIQERDSKLWLKEFEALVGANGEVGQEIKRLLERCERVLKAMAVYAV